MQNHLFVQTAFLGDLLLSIPFLKEHRRIFPHATLTLVCRKGLGSMMENLGLVARAVEIEKGRQETYTAAADALRDIQFEKIFLAHESFRSALFVNRLRKDQVIAYKNIPSFLFRYHRVDRPLSLPEPLRLLALMENCDEVLKQRMSLLGKEDFAKEEGKFLKKVPSWASMDISREIKMNLQIAGKLAQLAGIPEKDLSDESLHLIQLKIFGGKPKAAIFPGSVWATKRYTLEGFISIGQDLVRKGYDVVIMGGPGEEDLSQQISSEIPGSVDMTGKLSIAESLRLVLEMKFVIGNDSASAHMASACGIPTLTFFGPTILPFGYRPWGNAAAIIQKENLFCRPCGPHGHKVCPRGTHECMKTLSANDIQPKLDAIIENLL